MGQLHTVDFVTRATSCFPVPTTLGAAVPRTDAAGYIAAIAEGFGTITADGSLTVTTPLLSTGSRMNDAKCDAAGRLWAGSCALDFAAAAGQVHVLDADLAATTVLDGFTLPNGMGWSPTSDRFYLVDSICRTISVWDYDLASAQLTNKRTFTPFADDAGLPDGLCIDTDGFLWVAMWGGHQIIVLSPDGDRIRSIPLPVAQPTSCAFAGTNRDVLIVTSARDNLGANATPADGSVLAIYDTGSQGTPVPYFGG
uniref:SMP-30/Gluconolactonase/LRE-like region domain-containing protein n=1 Tax=Mycolicibacterium brisbanense TaxID=146020 RepID=B8R4I1_9MYCO|nr:hypothetical protein [Mycolicibacterium brisbanense]